MTETGGKCPFRVSPDPFPLPKGLVETLSRQGTLWLKFLRGAQEIYFKSLRGEAPAWVAEYLDAGKPARVVEYGRMNRFHPRFAPVIRPDILLTDEGPQACELDSVPGGFGTLACLSRLYEAEGCPVIGGVDGVVAGFKGAMAYSAGVPNPRVAIAVSEEAGMYLPEMRWLARAVSARGTECRAVSPAELASDADGVRLGGEKVDAVYRFFEMFDLPNIANIDDLLTAARMKQVAMAPPPKAFLEEKLLFALLHHPFLASLWEEAVGEPEFHELRALVIPTWVMDARPVPPHALIAGFLPGGRPLSSWEGLGRLTQRERELVVKPSGFSAEAWGSHGVSFGQDLSRGDWMGAVREALEAFPERPHVIQPFRRPSLLRSCYFDPSSGAGGEMEGRVRLTPYYFVTGPDEAPLGGILATICPSNKKAVHGMPEAVMAPCRIAEDPPDA